MAERYVKGYEGEPVRKKVKLVTEEYEYELPFNYENVEVDRYCYYGSEFHGIELNNINSVNAPDGPGNIHADSITIYEDDPIVRVVVIGSACTPPGYIQIECEPVDTWRRKADLKNVMPVRMRINGLWGMHMRFDQWYAEGGEIIGVKSEEKGGYEEIPEELLKIYPWMAVGHMKVHSREFPLAGMSCAVFEIPPSKSVKIMGGGETPGWKSDNFPDDSHYSFRMVRTTVVLNEDYPVKR